METYTPRNDIWHESVLIPQDGVDMRKAETVNVGMQSAMDNVAYVNNNRVPAITRAQSLADYLSAQQLDFNGVTLGYQRFQNVVRGDRIMVTASVTVSVDRVTSGAGLIGGQMRMNLDESSFGSIVAGDDFMVTPTVTGDPVPPATFMPGYLWTFQLFGGYTHLAPSSILMPVITLFAYAKINNPAVVTARLLAVTYTSTRESIPSHLLPPEEP